ncbi:hypothetical protein C8R46DRAFT_1030599 [Mycena filopes]|nr:hypothetical protein C8R46DRAFT_1030599 [Mycena filopes]
MDTTDPDAALVVARVRASRWFDPGLLTTIPMVPKIASVQILAPLLLSNDAPNPAQRTATQRFLEQYEASLSKVRIERSEVEFAIRALADVESAIRALNTARLAIIVDEQAKQAEIHLWRDILSPIRRIPPELIQEIFLLLTPSLDLWYLPDDPGPIPKVQIPWHLGHISRSWRHIAHSLGSLWSAFDITVASDIHFNEPHNSHRLPAAVARCLQRSAQAPISLRVHNRAADFDDSNHIIPELITMFATHAHRLKRMDLVALPDDVLDSLCRPAPTNNSFSPTSTFPKLTDLTLTRLDLPSHASSSIPWMQLLKYEEVHCQWPSWRDRWLSYSQLLNVDNLTIEFGRQFPVHPPSSGLLLPRLSKARIVLSGEQHFLHLFEMPNVQTLIYEHSFHRFSAEDNQAPTIHLPHSMSHLQVLQIWMDGNHIPHPFVNFTNLLTGSPRLRVLSISIPHLVVDTLVAGLLPSEHHPPLVQNLETVHLWGSRFNGHARVEKMLQFRFEPGAENVTSMRSFAMFSPEPRSFHEQMIKSCARLNEKGWAITVKDELYWGGDASSDDFELEPELTAPYSEYVNEMYSFH